MQMTRKVHSLLCYVRYIIYFVIKITFYFLHTQKQSFALVSHLFWTHIHNLRYMAV